MSAVPISTIVNVQISRQTQAVTQAGFGVPLILTDEDSGWSTRVREYVSIDEVLEDFASATDTYKAANAIFAQSPTVELVKVGSEATRVAQVVTVVFSADIVTGNSIALTVDDTDFTQAFDTNHLTSMNALAAQIAALDTIATAVVGGGSNRTITITANFAGVDIAVGTAVVTGGASQATAVTTTTVVNHGVAEDLAEISDEDDDWYGLIWFEREKYQVLQCASYIEAKRKIFLTCSDDTDILDSGVTDDVASLLSLANYDRTAILFNEDPLDFIDAALMGKCFPFDPGNETWKFKELNGLTADNLTSSERSSATDKNCNIYVSIGGVDITMEGVMASGEFIDVIRGVDWIQARMEERVYSKLVNLPKIPFTDEGIAIIEAEIRAVLENAEKEKIIADDPKFTLFVPKAVDVPTNDRANRFLPDIEFTARLAGAIHKVTIQGVVTV